MSINIQITPEIENDLRLAAANAGVSPDSYAISLLQQGLKQHSPRQTSYTRLSRQESRLLQQINHSLSSFDWPRYHLLIAKRQAEMLTSDEQEELIALSDQIETANVRRIEALAQLAQLRQTTIKALINEHPLK